MTNTTPKSDYWVSKWGLYFILLQPHWIRPNVFKFGLIPLVSTSIWLISYFLPFQCWLARVLQCCLFQFSMKAWRSSEPNWSTGTKLWPNELTVYSFQDFVRAFGKLFRLIPSSRSRHRLCWRTATSTHFRSSTIYTTFHREATLKRCGYMVGNRSRFSKH